MKNKNATLLTILGILFSFASFAGDILTLNNEMVFEGKITKIKGCSIVFVANHAQFVIPATEIYSIQFEDTEDKVYRKYMEMRESSMDNCFAGRLDAQLYHGKKGGHFVLGVLFGPFAMIGTALANPTPDKSRKNTERSKNKDLFGDPEYIQCYKKKAKGQLIGAEALGWGSYLLLALFLAASSTN
jgi:hypothetical protein